MNDLPLMTQMTLYISQHAQLHPPCSYAMYKYQIAVKCQF